MRIRQLGSRSVSSGTERFARVPRAHAPSARVFRRELPYWRERGWVCEGNVYHGVYQTPFGGFQGLVEDRGWGKDLRFYMFNPPRAVRRSSHWACFSPRGEKGFHVHMGVRPKDVSSGILTIEQLLSEAFRAV